MLSLLIDNKEAIIKTGTTFKLTRVNPYFDTTGDYTFEVTLPLRDSPQNRAIFGHIDLPQSSHTPIIGQRHPMTLIAPPITLTGYAQITSITEAEVKVQLIAGTGALCNSLTDEDNNPLYVDQIDLGKAWDRFSHSQSHPGDPIPGTTMADQVKIFETMPTDTAYDPLKLAFGTYGQTDTICLPVCADPDHGSQVFNAFDFSLDRPRLARTIYNHIIAGSHGNPYGSDGNTTITRDDTIITPQPYLLDILQRIIQATGYHVGDWSAYTTNPLTTGLYIVNVHRTLDRAKALPHWTLKELLTQVQSLLGATFTISGDGHTVNLIPRPDYYSPQHIVPYTLTSVIDTHTTDIDQKAEANDNATASITYKFPDISPMLQLPDEVWENAQIITLLSIAEVRNHFANLTPEQVAASHILYRTRVPVSTYAILSRADDYTVYELTEVDQLAPLIPDPTKRDNLTELKIIPARVARSVNNWHDETSTAKGPGTAIRALQEATPDQARPIPICTGDTRGEGTLYSVDEAINGDSSSDNRNSQDTPRDILELSWYGGLTHTSCTITPDGTTPIDTPCPISIPYVDDPTTGHYIRPALLHIPTNHLPPHGPFSLSDTAQGTTISSIGTLLTGAASIDTRVEHQVQFLDDIPLDPTATLLIAGRRYAIHKLEITLTPTGIDPLKTAYLYEIH